MRAMLDKLPDWIDPVNSAEHNKRFVSRVKQGQLKRLSEFLVSAENDVVVDARFFRFPKLKLPAVELHLETIVRLQCQRSLKAFDLPLKTSMTGVFTESMALVEGLDESVEVFELTSDKVSLTDLVEEELLIHLPMVPVDDNAQMEYVNDDPDSLAQETAKTSQDSVDLERKENPFAVLKTLQSKD